MNAYAVIFSYSFDHADTSVYLFKTEEEARGFMLSCMQEELRIDIEENGWDTEWKEEYDLDGAIVRVEIINHFFDRDDVTTMQIGRVYA